jgi:pSer/pThr/pTyr-binding forkhead associated (FHA) protein
VEQSRPSPHLASPVELKRRIEAERTGEPFVIYRDEGGEQRILRMPEDVLEVTIGRHGECDVLLDWDELVSGLHAQLRSSGGHWIVVDDGLSRNGTFVNEDRVRGQRRLRDRDVIRVGRTAIAFHRARGDAEESTDAEDDWFPAPALTPSQRRVLEALCRPLDEAGQMAIPASNEEIARETHLSVDAVKAHLRATFAKFGIADLPPHRKRIRLAELAMRSGSTRNGV